MAPTLRSAGESNEGGDPSEKSNELTHPIQGIEVTCGECVQKINAADVTGKCMGTCRRNFHLNCVDISNKDYQTILSIKNTKWLCNGCTVQFDSSMEIIQQFENLKFHIDVQLNKFKTVLEASNGHAKNVNDKRSFADVAKDVVIIKPKEKQDCKTTKSEIQENLRPDSLELGILQIKDIKDGGVLIKCQTKEDSEKLKSAAEKKFKKKYSVKVPQLENPSFKIVGIEEALSANELESCILKQNSHLQHKDLNLNIKIIKQMKSKYMAIIQSDTQTHEKVIKDGRLYIGWSVCRVFDYVSVFRCFRCGGFDHKAAECSQPNRCLKCGDTSHQMDVCTFESWKCVNCTDAVINLKLNLSTDHSPFSEECSCLQRKVSLQKRKLKISDHDK